MINWEDHVYYDETSKSCLRYSRKVRHDLLKGHTVGSINKGRWSFVLSVNDTKQRRYNHRIIWELFNGSISNHLVIDHIDGDPLNNKINNLRQVTMSVNNRNRKADSRNKSGITGVIFHTVNGYDYWQASWIDINSKRKCKSFSCFTHGSDVALRMAIEHRTLKIEEAGNYTDRHGVMQLNSKYMDEI